MKPMNSFIVNCPYCRTDSEYSLTDVHKSYCLKSHWSLGTQYTIKCKNCGKKLFITSNFKNQKYSILEEEEDTDE